MLRRCFEALEAKLACGPATCTLVCSDGSISASADIVSIASNTLRDALAISTLGGQKHVPSKRIPLPDVDIATAKLLLDLVYPVPEIHVTDLSTEQLERVLPIIHKYDFEWLRKDAEQRMAKELDRIPGTYSPNQPDYLLKCLLVADVLKLQQIEEKCLCLARVLPRSKSDFLLHFKQGSYDADLDRLSRPLMMRFLKAAA